MTQSLAQAWVRIASSVRSRRGAQLLLNAPLARTARWKAYPGGASCRLRVGLQDGLHVISIAHPVETIPPIFQSRHAADDRVQIDLSGSQH